jgi:hypothetical protein
MFSLARLLFACRRLREKRSRSAALRPPPGREHHQPRVASSPSTGGCGGGAWTMWTGSCWVARAPEERAPALPAGPPANKGGYRRKRGPGSRAPALFWRPEKLEGVLLGVRNVWRTPPLGGALRTSGKAKSRSLSHRTPDRRKRAKYWVSDV